MTRTRLRVPVPNKTTGDALVLGNIFPHTQDARNCQLGTSSRSTVMESIATLRSVLATTLTARGHGEQDLFDDLILHKSRLRDLLDVGQPSPQEQRELHSGPCSFISHHRVRRSLLCRKDHHKWQVSRRQHRLCPASYIPRSAAQMLRKVHC